jgi:osmoprotectant transport system ATP-binding protein
MDKLQYDHVSKAYASASNAAVNEVTLAVPAGHLVVFLGPSGSGKTTLLKMTNRLIEPSGGTIFLDGQDIRQAEVTGLRRRMGYVIQQVGLFPHMTVAENVAVVPDLLGWPRKRTEERIDELLDLVHLPPGEFRKRYPAQLSGGQQQRVGLARALAADPEVLLMDEPFGAIDSITRGSLQAEILQLHQRLNKTILFVTHDVEEALRLADEIAVLRAGELVQFGPACELLSRPADDFVRELLGADDRIRGLRLIQAGDVMQPLWAPLPVGRRLAVPVTGGDTRTLQASASLHEALGLLLEPGVEALVISGEDGHAAGWLTMQDVKEAACGSG